MSSLTIIQSTIVAFSHHRGERIISYPNVGIALNHPAHDPIGHARDIQGIR